MSAISIDDVSFFFRKWSTFITGLCYEDNGEDLCDVTGTWDAFLNTNGRGLVQLLGASGNFPTNESQVLAAMSAGADKEIIDQLLERAQFDQKDILIIWKLFLRAQEKFDCNISASTLHQIVSGEVDIVCGADDSDEEYSENSGFGGDLFSTPSNNSAPAVSGGGFGSGLFSGGAGSAQSTTSVNNGGFGGTPSNMPEGQAVPYATAVVWGLQASDKSRIFKVSLPQANGLPDVTIRLFVTAGMGADSMSATMFPGNPTPDKMNEQQVKIIEQNNQTFSVKTAKVDGFSDGQNPAAVFPAAASIYTASAIISQKTNEPMPLESPIPTPPQSITTPMSNPRFSIQSPYSSAGGSVSNPGRQSNFAAVAPAPSSGGFGSNLFGGSGSGSASAGRTGMFSAAANNIQGNNYASNQNRDTKLVTVLDLKNPGEVVQIETDLNGPRMVGFYQKNKTTRGTNDHYVFLGPGPLSGPKMNLARSKTQFPGSGNFGKSGKGSSWMAKLTLKDTEAAINMIRNTNIMQQQNGQALGYIVINEENLANFVPPPQQQNSGTRSSNNASSGGFSSANFGSGFGQPAQQQTGFGGQAPQQPPQQQQNTSGFAAAFGQMNQQQQNNGFGQAPQQQGLPSAQSQQNPQSGFGGQAPQQPQPPQQPNTSGFAAAFGQVNNQQQQAPQQAYNQGMANTLNGQNMSMYPQGTTAVNQAMQNSVNQAPAQVNQGIILPPANTQQNGNFENISFN
tara:strand:- start:90398 stop:92602 length:2205 start_codon:yes stop_codon:yes gene_type:complete